MRGSGTRRRVGIGLATAGALAAVAIGGAASAASGARVDGDELWQPGPSGRQVVYERNTVPPHSTGWARADCPSGKWIMGGGASAAAGVYVVNSVPGSYNSWYVYVDNPTGAAQPFSAYAVCGT